MTISLPMIKNKPADDMILSNTKEKSSHGKRILLVEDEPEISDVQYKILTQEPCNHQVDIVGSGQGAIACFRKMNMMLSDWIIPGNKQKNSHPFYFRQYRIFRIHKQIEAKKCVY